MNKTLTFMLIAGLFFGLVTTGLMAQERRRPEGPPKPPDSKQVNQMVIELTRVLSLTGEQQDQIRKLFLAHFDEVRSLARQEGTDREAQRLIMDKKRREFEKAVNDLLTDEQKVRFKEFMSKRGQRSERRPGRR